GRMRVVVNLSAKVPELLKWREAVIVIEENGRLVIDDFVSYVDETPPREEWHLSTGFPDCRGGKWIGN
ncbi:MAG TPA: hypothetical protein VMU84_15375, partial [Thermoanaerobaculia bacterium]|nr:hypothetical protein [Thermoanaerobaculia bacterium]